MSNFVDRISRFRLKLLQSKVVGFGMFVFERFLEVRVPQVSASLTFTTLLALVPVLTVSLVVASALPVFEGLSTSFAHFINNTIVPQGVDTVFNYIEQFKDKASNLTAIGIGMLLITSLLLIRTIDQTFNHIWSVKNQRSLWMQFLVYWALLTFGPLAVGTGITVWALVLKYSQINELLPFFSDGLGILTSILFSTLILWLLYWLVPNRFVPVKQALLGAVITAILLEVAKSGFSWYVSTFDGYTLIYGAFAAIPLFLLWINLLWMLVLTGAVFTSSLSYWQNEAFLRRFDSQGRFDDVLKILLLLNQAQAKGQAVEVRILRRHVNLGYDELGDLLEQLANYGYVYQGKQGWVLKKGADNIIVKELFRLFVYHPTKQDSEVDEAIHTIINPCLDALGMTLAEFAEQAEEIGQAVH